MVWKMRSFSLSLVLTMLTLLGYANPLHYSALDLGTLGGACAPQGLNDFGQVVGYSYISADVQHAFLFSGGNMIDLGTLGGNGSQAFGINNRGQGVGNSYTASGQMNAFFFSDGAMTDLGFDGGAASINNAGLAVGTGNSPDFHAFQFSAGTGTNLGLFGANTSTATGVNNLGQVAGRLYYRNDSNTFRAYIYSNGVATVLGTLGGASSEARGLNDLGQVVGSSGLANGGQHAFIYSGGAMYDIGAIGGPDGYSYAQAINNLGQVVGYALGVFNGMLKYRAFLYDQGDMIDLNSLVTLNTTLGFAFGINSSSQIIASGYNGHAYLLTPVAAAPEPDCMDPIELRLGRIQRKRCVLLPTH